MTATSPESLALLGRAAELRAEGTPWPEAATQLALGHDQLRQLVAEHRRDYERFARRARAQVLRETLCEALATLRAQLRSPDTRVSFLASTTIIRYELARMRHGTGAARARLDRDTRCNKLTVEARDLPEENMSESLEVPTETGVNAAKKVAHAGVPAAAAGASPSPPRPAPAAPAVAPVAAKSQTPLDDAARRTQRMVDRFALDPVPPAPLARGDRKTLEVDRLISGWLTQGE